MSVSFSPPSTCSAFIFSAGLGMILLTGGCRTASYSASHGGEAASAPDLNVELASGDTIELKFFYSPELNDLQMIRPDGSISTMLVGDVQAAGLAPQQLAAALKTKYAPHIEKPEVSVFVRKYNSRYVYVGGAVLQPGLVEMPGDMTALDAVMHAGGIDLRYAEPRNVLVVRDEKGTRQNYALDFDKALQPGASSVPFYLHARDIIYVPRSRITDVDQWIEQHINRFMPNIGITFLKTTGDTQIGVNTYR